MRVGDGTGDACDAGGGGAGTVKVGIGSWGRGSSKFVTQFAGYVRAGLRVKGSI